MISWKFNLTLKCIYVQIKYGLVCKDIPAVHSRISSSYPSEQSGAPSQRYWIEMQFPSPGHLNGSYGWQASIRKKGNTLKLNISFYYLNVVNTYWHIFLFDYNSHANPLSSHSNYNTKSHIALNLRWIENPRPCSVGFEDETIQLNNVCLFSFRFTFFVGLFGCVIHIQKNS